MSLHTIGIAIALALGVAGLAPPVAAQGVFSRGDCDQSRLYDLTDPIVLLGFLFLGGEEPVCLDACDADDNEDLEITDAIVSLGFLFLGGPPPPPPFPREAVDPGGLDLGCLNGRLPLLELRLVPSRLTFHRLGNSAVMLLRGREESGEVVDVPLVDAEILLSADGVVEIDDGGLVVARAVGSVLVTALFQGSEAQARVEVRPGAADELVVELTSPPDGAIVSSDSVQISGRVSDPLADLTIDGPAIEPRSVAAPGGRFSVAVPLVPGKNTFQVSARRKGQEASAAIAVRRVEPGTPAAVGPDGQLFPAVPAPFTEPPDLEPPAIRIASPAAGARLESAVIDVVGTVDDPGAEVRVNAVLAVVEDGEFRVRGLRLTPGENVLVATAVDTVGNQASDEARVEVDSTRPRIFLNGPLRDGILVAGVSAVTVRGGVEPAGSSVSVAGEPAVVNGGTFSARLSLEEGLHDLVITAAAPGDGRKRSQIVRALRVDLTPPRLDILFPALESLMSSGGFSTAADSVTIAGRVFDAGTPLDRAEPVTLTVEGQPPLEAFGTFAVTVPLAAGENVLRLLTADARGNESERELRVVRETRPDARLVRLSGSDQTVEAGSAVPRPFVVRALDAFGVPAAGVPVTFRVAGGSGTFAGGVRRLDVETHGGGDASATYTAGRRAGRAAEVITVSAPGRPDPQVVFVVHTTVRSARVLVPHGPTRRLGSAGDNLSVTVRLLDDAGNPLEGEVVRFRWSEDPLPLDAGGDEALRLTDAAGRATLEFVLPPRDYSSVLEASVADGMVEAHTVRFAVRGLQAGAVLDTAIAGVLLDGRDRPLAGWIVGVVGAADVEGRTDAAGRFSLGGVPAGEVLLEARAPDASVAGRFRVTTPVGRVRVLEDPLRLPGTEEPPPAAATLVGPERGGVLALPGLPGFRLEVPAGSVLFPDGSSSGVLRAARSNLRLAGGLLADGVLPELAVTILPEGVLFRRGVRLVLPNPGFLPGSLPHLFARSPGAGGFLETALSTVTPDGFAVSTLLPSGSRGGLYFFEIPGPAGGTTGSVDGEVRVPIPALKDVPQRQDSYVGGFNVYVHSGEFFLEETDLEIRGRGLSYRFRRRYESRHLFHGSLGWNWEHEYADRRLYPGVVPGNVIRADGSGNFDEYLMDAQTETFVSPVGRFSRLFRDAGGFLVERTPQGTRYRYFPLSRSALSGRLESIADRRGNRLRMVRGAGGRLEQVIDSLGRSIDYVHDASGRIVRVRDFAGRELTFQYDDEGNLVAATGPAITGTPNSNNFLEGRRVEYLYSAGFDDPRLRHNLLEIIDPREVSAGTRVPWLTNRYQENPALPGFDRVVAQEWGGTDATGVAAGGTLHFEYIDTPGAGDERVVAEGLAAHLLREAGTTRIRDREENVTAVRWSGAGLPLSVRLFTRAGLRPRDVTTRQPPPGTVPRFYETRYRWSVDGLLEVVEQPRGKRTEYTYDGDAPLRSSRANCVRVERHPAGEIGGVEVVERLHDPLFARVVAETAPRFALDPREAPVHRWLLDYQEGQELEALAEEAGVAPDDLADALTWAGVELGLGDLNGDGVTGQRQGNRVRQELPTATLPDGSEQTAYRLFTFNHFGQLTSRRDANGVVSRWSYYPEVDPDGDGTAQPADGLDASTGGYLEAVILDSDRVGDIAPLEVTTVYHYDVLGRVTRVVDPRRSEFEFVYNALGELVEQRMPPSLRFRRWFFYDADGHLVKTRVENFRGSDANVPLFVVGNAWIDADFSYDLLGQLVTASREVSEGEVGPAKILTETRRYDRNGRLVEVRRGDSPPETWTYDERGLAISRTLGAGTPEAATFTTHRDTAGHVVLAVDAEDSDGDGQAEVEERRYDGHGRLVAVIDPAGGTRLFERGVGGVVVSESFLGAPGGPAPEVPGSGNVLLERTGTEYDERGRMVRRTRELFGGKEARRRLVEEIYRDPEGRVVRRVGPGGEELTLLRDALGRVVGEQHPSGSRLEREYDPNGNVLVEIHSEVAAEIMDPGLADDPDYDEEGRLRRRSHLVHLHDALDRRVMTIDEDGGAWRARYDSRGNLIFLSDAEGTVITAAAEPEVLPVLDLLTDRMRNRLTGHGNRVRYVYDNLGRLISVGHEMRRRGAGGAPIDGTNPFDIDGTGTVSFEWSDANRLVGWTEDDGRRTRLVLDAVGHPVRKIWPDNSEEAWDVDRDGHPRRLIDRNGSVITQRFDALHRLVERRIEPGPGVQGTTRQLFEYDGLSRTTFLFDDNSPVDSTDDSRVSRRYDSLGRLVEECQDGFCFVREHDDEGRVVSLRYPDGRLLETPRAADGGIATLAVDGRAFAVYGRLSSGRLVEKTLGVGVRLSYIDTDERGIPRLLGFDRRGNVVRHEYSSDVGELIVGFEYGRNSWGLPLFERQLHVRRTPGDVWRYDSIYRVRLYIPDVFDPRVPPVNPLRKLEFIHDPSHNWRFVEVDQGRREVEVGLRNEFLLFDDEALEYDRRGNLTSFRNRSFVYDALDRLVRIVDGGSDVARYRYDADGANEPLDYAGSGRRVSKDVRQPAQNQPAGFTRFTYAGTLPAEERDARARIVRQYFHEDGGRTEVFLQHLDGLVPEPFVFLHNDAGSNVAVVDARGIVVESARYGLHGEPAVLNRFGNLVAFPGTANPRYFGGLVWDFESGFHAVGGRYFFPELGRYLTDAAPFILREPLAVNGYLRPGLAPFPGQVTGGGLPLARRAFLDAFRVRLEPPRSLLSPPAARGTLSSKIRQLLSLASSGGEK